jgi:hypothetical protein
MEGQVTEGVSVLSTPGWLGSLSFNCLNLWLDLCADIMQLSKWFYLEMRNPASLKKGLKLKLYHLTDNNTHLSGYIQLLVFFKTIKDKIVEATTKAYVVPNMVVNILLGEEFQQNYRVNINCMPGQEVSVSSASQEARI